MPSETIEKARFQLNEIKVDIEKRIQAGTLSSRYRGFIHYYFSLLRLLDQNLAKIAQESNELLAMEAIDLTVKVYYNQILQMYYYLLKKSNNHGTENGYHEKLLEYVIDDALARLKYYDYQMLVTTDVDEKSPTFARLLPFSIDMGKDWRGGLVLVNPILIQDLVQWVIIGHEVGHLCHPERNPEKMRQEFWADLTAVNLFGPHFIISTLNHSKDSPYYSIYNEHPPWVYRLDNVLSFEEWIIKKNAGNVELEREICERLGKEYAAEKRKKADIEKELSPEMKMQLDEQLALTRRKFERYLVSNSVESIVLTDKMLSCSEKELKSFTPIQLVQYYAHHRFYSRLKPSKKQIMGLINDRGE